MTLQGQHLVGLPRLAQNMGESSLSSRLLRLLLPDFMHGRGPPAVFHSRRVYLYSMGLDHLEFPEGRRLDPDRLLVRVTAVVLTRPLELRTLRSLDSLRRSSGPRVVLLGPNMLLLGRVGGQLVGQLGLETSGDELVVGGAEICDLGPQLVELVRYVGELQPGDGTLAHVELGGHVGVEAAEQVFHALLVLLALRGLPPRYQHD
mmetsp:Transcript_17513/g.29505  ORF Transcript_17513/g.29505 Transcript_17513/m.29505 type:complete len:204 (-) Transcript_17513:1528-2139(-)